MARPRLSQSRHLVLIPLEARIVVGQRGQNTPAAAITEGNGLPVPPFEVAESLGPSSSPVLRVETSLGRNR